MSLLELRELRYFLVIAEELHFGRAAQRLHIAQPALSKAIRAMEVKLAVTLLERTTRQARLTAAGEVLVRQARIVLEAAAAASNLTRRSADGALTVAAKASEAALARRLLDLHREAHPDLRVGEVSVCGWGEAIARLRMGVADVALLRDPPPLEGLDWEGLAQEPRLVALGASHRLARRRRLRLDELDAEPRATWPDADAQTTAFWQARDMPSAADRPPDGPAVSDLGQLLEVVSPGQAVAFLPTSVAERYPHSGVVVRPVSGLSDSTIGLAVRPPPRPSDLDAFLDRARELARADQVLSGRSR